MGSKFTLYHKKIHHNWGLSQINSFWLFTIDKHNVRQIKMALTEFLLVNSIVLTLVVQKLLSSVRKPHVQVPAQKD